MERRELLKLFTLTPIALAIASCQGGSSQNKNGQNIDKDKPQPPVKQQPNIIFILMDDVSREDLGCYGNSDISTPNIDALAKNGAQFENAYLVTASCTASRASFLTGRYPHNHGAPELHSSLPANQITVPQVLQENGYFTLHAGKNHTGDAILSSYDEFYSSREDDFKSQWAEFVKKRPAQKPFFFWFAPHDAHRPFEEKEVGQIFNPDNLSVPPYLIDDAQTREDLAKYYHEISITDYYVGELVEALKSEELLESTYIIFASDNGRPFPRSKVLLYETSIALPLSVVGPGINPNSSINALVSAVDVSTTIIDIADAQIPETFQGLSFKNLLSNVSDQWSRNVAFAERNWHLHQGHERVVIHENWRYMKNQWLNQVQPNSLRIKMYPEFLSEASPSAESIWQSFYNQDLTKYQSVHFDYPDPILESGEELYDIENDPLQLNNLAQHPEHQDVLVKLRRTLSQWVEETGDSVPSKPRENFGDPTEKPGEENQATVITNKGPYKI